MRSNTLLKSHQDYQAETLMDVLEMRAYISPEQVAYSFLREDGITIEMTYAQLHRRAMIIAAHLDETGMQGQRAVLLYQPGFEYIAAFFGCLYAGVVAVPAFAPRLNARRGVAGFARIRGIVNDAQAAVMLTSQAALQAFGDEGAADIGGDAVWVATDALPEEVPKSWRRVSVSPDALAFLQYTSGSTADPRGVMLTHAALFDNLEQIRRNVRIHADSHAVIWLPPYHDMGLIGGILEPIYSGISANLMAPATAIQRPLTWLSAISGRKNVISGGPNFAFDLCVQRIKPEQRDKLDLSGWEVAFSGAEPISAETLRRFAEYFAVCGFRSEAFYPCYGLAEATLYVTGTTLKRDSHAKAFARGALEQGHALPVGQESDQAHWIVSCGSVDPSQQLEIVDPDTNTLLPPGQVGEIWVAGPSMAAGYWNRPAETAATFDGRLPKVSERRFLRTGDLGFVHDGEVFVTGRIKDLIIIGGRNHYPQDIELTAVKAHPALRPHGGAAFPVDVEGEERLVIVHELNPFDIKANPGEVIAAVRRAVSEHHQVQVFAIALLKAGDLPRTSSGKIQRRLCREKFRAGTLDAVFIEQR
jgi:acyl-CoA synthetase (AMP-forming)/AMP-acid ligase II